MSVSKLRAIVLIDATAKEQMVVWDKPSKHNRLVQITKTYKGGFERKAYFDEQKIVSEVNALAKKGMPIVDAFWEVVDGPAPVGMRA